MTKTSDIKEIRMALPDGIVRSGKFNDNDLRLLDALSILNGTEYAKENGEFFATNEKLKELAEIKDNMTLSRCIKKLERNGFFGRIPGKRGMASVYVLHEDRMEAFSLEDVNQNQCKKPKKRVTTMEETVTTIEETVTNKVTNETMLPKLIINELQKLQETVTSLVTEIKTLNSNMLKISMGNNSNKNGIVTTDTDTESETEMSLIESTHIVTSPEDKKKEEKEKRKFSPAGDAQENENFSENENEVSGKAGDSPYGTRDDDGLFSNKKPAVAQRPSGWSHPDPSAGVSHKEDFPTASGVGDSAYPHSGEQEEKTPPPPAADIDRQIAWADAAMAEAEASGDREAYQEALKARMAAALSAQLIPYPDTEPLGMVVSDVHNTVTHSNDAKKRKKAMAYS